MPILFIATFHHNILCAGTVKLDVICGALQPHGAHCDVSGMTNVKAKQTTHSLTQMW